MSEEYLKLIILIVVLLVSGILYRILNRKINLKKREKVIDDLKKELGYNEKKGKPSNINEWSYQRFCKFFDETELKDSDFDKKIETIYDLIVHKNYTDLDEIAEKSGCNYEELILKILYLKNKMKIDQYMYIDKGDHVIRHCSDEDAKLLDKYSKYIYTSHYQPYQIAAKMPGTTIETYDKAVQQVLDDLAYLDEKYLISGINIDKVDKKIIYYTVEKHKKEKDYISINCNKCGALVEVPRDGKERCPYCKNIVEDKTKN